MAKIKWNPINIGKIVSITSLIVFFILVVLGTISYIVECSKYATKINCPELFYNVEDVVIIGGFITFVTYIWSTAYVEFSKNQKIKS